MSKKEKLVPKDSEEQPKKDKQTADPAGAGRYQREDADMKNPARKRKYSEQPPTKHNSKT